MNQICSKQNYNIYKASGGFIIHNTAKEFKDGPVSAVVTVNKDAKLNYQPIYISCPECQVLDNERHPDAKLGATLGIRQSTSLYDMIVAKPQNAKPAGEWNKVKITVKRNAAEIPFDITRDKIPVNSIDAAFMIDETTGYIKLSKFTRTTFM